MGIFDKAKNLGQVERHFIELADEHKKELVYKWPDQQIRKHTKVTVDLDYVAVFTDRGNVIDVLGPGQHTIGQGPSPLTAWIIDHVTADGYFDTELFYVTTRDLLGIKFGGPVDQVIDKTSQTIFSLRVFGDVAISINDPVKFLTKLAGTSGVEQHTKLAGWVASQVLAATREEIPPLVAEHGILELGRLQDQTEEIVRAKANLTLADWGIAIGQFGEMHINLDETDLKELKDLALTKKRIEMAGGDYEKYMRGEALRNLGTADGSGIGAAVTLAMLQNQTQHQKLAAAAGAKFCTECGTAQPAEGKFCSECGKPRT